MARLTDIDDLLDGVSVWLGIAPKVLEDLLPRPDRDLGLRGGATDRVQDAAWRRICDDCYERGYDLENADLEEDDEDRVKAGCCNLVMFLLYDRAVIKADDSRSFLAQKYYKEYERIVGTLDITNPDGQEVDLGSGGVSILRGS